MLELQRTNSRVIASGVDTVSYAFRQKDERALSAFRATAHRGGAAGALITDERGPDGGRVMSWPGHGLLVHESRLGALLAGDGDDHSLVAARELVAGATAARYAIADVIGEDPGSAVEVRRFDLASELRFGAGPDGLAFLDSLVGICPARARVDVVRGDDHHAQTVYVKTAKRGVVLSRVYDKGRESGTDPPGERIRIESQNRPPKARRYSPEVLSQLDLSSTFGRTMTAYLDADEVVAAGPTAAVGQLLSLAHRGDLTFARAQSLIGAVAILQYAGRAGYHDPGVSTKENNRRSSRRLKGLRDAGITLDAELPAEALVPTSKLLRDAIAEFSA